ncbi:MAG: hypothetical protein U1F77_10015 [Kiritimatiellia bacterium]
MNTRAVLPILCGLPLLAGALETVVTAGAASNLVVVADAIKVDSTTGNATLTENSMPDPARGRRAEGRADPDQAKLIETKPGGAEDILSAPQVLALSGQEAMITVGQELPVAPDGDLPKDLPAGLMTVNRVKLRITATRIGKDILLRGSVQGGGTGETEGGWR